MTTPDPAERLRAAIRRAEEAMEPITADDVIAATALSTTERRNHNDGMEGDWIVTTDRPELMDRRRSRWLAGAAAAALVAIVGIGLVVVAGSDDDPSVDVDADNDTIDAVDAADDTEGAASDDPDAATEEASARSPLDIVEARYAAMAALDMDAIDADVSPDVDYCRGDQGAGDGCFVASAGYFDIGGWGDDNKLRAIRNHAFGGAVVADCTAEGNEVTCQDQDRHRLLDLAETEMPPLIATYTVEDGRIVTIWVELTAMMGATEAAVARQETAYAAWVREEYPDRFGDLFLVGKVRLAPELAAEHRELVAEWVATLP
ncbi:MAG: hypothetical protein AAGD35_09440 [Actinomycetota bacterium]